MSEFIIILVGNLMTNDIHKKISIRLVRPENKADLYQFMQDETGRSIRNQKSAYGPKEFEAYYLHEIQSQHHFVLVRQGDQDVGYFQASINHQHRIAQIYFSFLWDHPTLTTTFPFALNLLTAWLKEKTQTERFVIPITGIHADIEALLLSCEQVKQSIVLAQEHLDKDHQRQPVTFYDYFLS